MDSEAAGIEGTQVDMLKACKRPLLNYLVFIYRFLRNYLLIVPRFRRLAWIVGCALVLCGCTPAKAGLVERCSRWLQDRYASMRSVESTSGSRRPPREEGSLTDTDRGSQGGVAPGEFANPTTSRGAPGDGLSPNDFAGLRRVLTTGKFFMLVGAERGRRLMLASLEALSECERQGVGVTLNRIENPGISAFLARWTQGARAEAHRRVLASTQSPGQFIRTLGGDPQPGELSNAYFPSEQGISGTSVMEIAIHGQHYILRHLEGPPTNAHRRILAASVLNQVLGLSSVPRAQLGEVNIRFSNGEIRTYRGIISERAIGGAIGHYYRSELVSPHALAEASVFEFLIGNTDVHVNNFALGDTREGISHSVQIFDHGEAFPPTAMLGFVPGNHVMGIVNLPSRYPVRLMAALESMTLRKLRQSVGHLLHPSEIEGIWFRRNALLADGRRNPSRVFP